MPRNYTKKTDRHAHSHLVYEQAVKEVVEGKALREVAEKTGLSKSTLGRKVIAYRTGKKDSLATDFKKSQIFTDEEESVLKDFITRCADTFYGLSTVSVRKLAYETATKNNFRVPIGWTRQKIAGEEWRKGFMSRHPNISLRTPEATSMARASAFNRHNINNFFDRLEQVITSTGVNAFTIYNLDETGFTTVQKPPKILAPKGKKQIGQATSAERGTLITVCAIICASGNSVPPAFVFPRVNFKEYMLHGAPEGSLGLAHQSGWMTADNFLQVLKHFISHTRPTADNPVLLIMDNHESHLSLEGLLYAKENHCTILTLPPHTSQKTQPLDRTVFAPLKSAYNRGLTSWIMRNPAKPVTIYNIAEIVGNAWEIAVTPRNIKRGFEAAGIWPFNRDIFSDEDFAASDVTDRQVPNSLQVPAVEICDCQPSTSANITHNDGQPSTSANNENQLSHSASNNDFQLSTSSSNNNQPSTSANDDDQPTISANNNDQPSTSANNDGQPPTSSSNDNQPSASANNNDQPSISANNDHQPSTSANNEDQPSTSSNNNFIDRLPTTNNNSSPPANINKDPFKSTTRKFMSPFEFRGLPKAEPRKSSNRGRKRGRAMIATSTPELNLIKEASKPKLAKSKRNVVRTLFPANESDSDDDINISDIVDDHDDDSMEDDEIRVIELGPVSGVVVGSYVLCEFATKRTKSYFIGMVTSAVDEDDDLEVKFLKKSAKQSGKFVISDEDPASFPLRDVKAILPQPNASGTTARTKEFLAFNVNFGDINIH